MRLPSLFSAGPVRVRRLVLLAAAFGAVAALAPSLGGCSVERAVVRRVAEAIGGDGFTMTEQDHWALGRFNTRLDAEMAGATASQRDDARSLFRDVYVRVRAGYVHDPDGGAMVDAALKGFEGEAKPKPGQTQPDPPVERALDALMASLDPHSAYYNPDEYRETRISTRGEFGGLGISVAMEGDAVKVVAPIKDTPAWRAGLKAGDLITHLDHHPVAGLTLMDAVRLMRGAPGTDIALTVKRGDLAPFDVTVTRAVITVKAVDWRMEGDWAYVKVGQFNQTVVETFTAAMSGIETASGGVPKGIVLDMRGNRGGLLNQSVALADAFLASGTIVSARGRRSDSNQVFTAEPGDMAEGVPTVVLIDGATASAAEIVTAALKENRRAVVMGVQSFGKGSVQTILPLSNDGAVKITTAIYYGPSGRAIQAHGITPDIRFLAAQKTDAASAEAAHGEAALPGALPAIDDSNDKPHGQLNPERCPAAGDDGKDHELGCALEFLRLGSEAGFLAEYGQRTAGG